MKYPPPTPAELEKLRQLLRDHAAHIRIFADDLIHLVAMRDASDANLLAALQVIVDKGERFMSMDESQFLNKEIRDERERANPPRAQRTYGHVVQSKKEKARRESGGGHVTSQFEPRGPLRGRQHMSDDDDDTPWDNDIPF